MLAGIICIQCLQLGCTTTGSLNLWPNQFLLLQQTKDLAKAARLPTNMATELDKSVLPAYFVEPGDELLIELIDLESETRLPGDQRVMIDGTIDLGAFGRLLIAGQTLEEIETAIEARIAELSDKREQINVRLLESNAAVVYVLGEVGSPGSYLLAGHETVLDAIVKAGGLTSKASPCEIILSRPTAPCDCRVVLPVCYRQIVQLGDTTSNYQLQPGDRIVVGSRSLLEELSFYKQRQACELCCRSSCAERNPRVADYRNRLMSLPLSPPVPMFLKRSTNEESIEQSTWLKGD